MFFTEVPYVVDREKFYQWVHYCQKILLPKETSEIRKRHETSVLTGRKFSAGLLHGKDCEIPLCSTSIEKFIKFYPSMI